VSGSRRGAGFLRDEKKSGHTDTEEGQATNIDLRLLELEVFKFASS
jgi:hypothetical protein